MGQEFYAIASTQVPIQGIRPLFSNVDRKKAEALQASAELTNRITGNVTEYQKRRAVEAEKRIANEKAYTEDVIRKMTADIANLKPWATNDPQKLQEALSKLGTLQRFGYNNLTNNIANEMLYTQKGVRATAEERLAQLQKGQEASLGQKTDAHIAKNNGAAFDYQPEGARDFLS